MLHPPSHDDLSCDACDVEGVGPMIFHVWRSLQPFFPPRGRLWSACLALESLVAGLLEALLLLLVVATALNVTGSDGSGNAGVLLPGAAVLGPARALTIAGLAGAVILVVHVHTAHLTGRLCAGVLRNAREQAIQCFASTSWSRQALDREGALQETTSTLSMQTSQLVIAFSSFLMSASGLMTLLAAAVVVDVVATLVVLVLGSLLFLLLRPIARLTQSRGREFVGRNSEFNEQVSQWAGLAKELRVFGVEKVEAARLNARNETTSAALARSRFMTRLGSYLYRDIAVLSLVVALVVLRMVGTIDVAAAGAVVLLIVRSLSYAQGTNGSLQQMNEQSAGLDALRGRLASLSADKERVGTKHLGRVTRMQIEEVSYEYEPGRPGIEGITLDISSGEVIGIIGASGAGKSTLVEVLLRLRQPTRGEVLVSGVPYEEIDRTSWHGLVALVPQEPKLFQGTVTENIRFFRDVPEDQVVRAARDAHVLADIEELPRGFETELGPRGSGLSGGQKQRVAIARALVGQPQLLVLDEPTSALDVRSENLLQSTIEELKGNIILVIVAHRLTTLRCCGRVVAMEDRRVKLVGSLEEAVQSLGRGEGNDAWVDQVGAWKAN